MKKLMMSGLIAGFLLFAAGCVVIPSPPGVQVRLPVVNIGYYGHYRSVHVNTNHHHGHRRVHNRNYQGHSHRR